MPLPLAHSLAGATLQSALDRDGPSAPLRLALAIFLANAPDLDLLPGILIGDPNRFHHGPTHSFVVAALVGVAVAWLAAPRRWPTLGWLGGGAGGTALLVASLWGSHVLLDLLTHDPSLPQGVPAAWPLSAERFHLADLFDRADKVVGPASPARFVASLFSAHNLRALGGEALLMGPPLAAVLWWRARRRRR